MKKLIIASLALILTGCGTTSNLKNSKEPTMQLKLHDYNTVIVNDFTDGVTKEKNDPKIKTQGKIFADMIANDLLSKKSFASIERNAERCDHAILIDGEITEYKEGNATARLLIGLGAGSSHFDVTVNIRDYTSKELLGVIKVDKMSWGLGGALAAIQDVTSHMKSSSEKISTQISNSKK